MWKVIILALPLLLPLNAWAGAGYQCQTDEDCQQYLPDENTKATCEQVTGTPGIMMCSFAPKTFWDRIKEYF